MTHPLIIFTPSGRRGHFPPGTTVLAAARALGVDLDSVCGGRGICGRCQCEIIAGEFAKHAVISRAENLSALEATEQRYAEKRHLAPPRRLGCQACIFGDLVIDIPRLAIFVPYGLLYFHHSLGGTQCADLLWY